MIVIRPAMERFHTQLDWLDSRHTFSFDRHYDPQHVGFRHLRVINEDRVQPGKGFPTHGHRDMEILTYVLEGALEHQDSLGHRSVIRPGELQRMSAGTGITHSEFNHSQDEPVHFLQIWIRPKRLGLQPSYEQRQFPIQEEAGSLLLLAAPDGPENTVTIHQDVRSLAGRLRAADRLEYALQPGRHAWVQVARGSVELNGTRLRAGDGAALSEEKLLTLANIEADPTAEILIFDLA
ncbi:MAG: pirin family protein [Acidobacteria bacterium]|nr:pirin family protein [Acidobacteriota bacterium]